MTTAVMSGIATGPLPSADHRAGLDPAAVARSLTADWLQALLDEAGRPDAPARGNGLHDANCAPVLAGSGTDFSDEGLALMLASLDSKCKEAQAQTAMNGIQVTRKQRDDACAARIERLKEALERASEAAAKAKSNKVWGWLGKVAAFIGAIVAVVAATAATIATGGAAAPLLAMALLGAVAATVDLANQINQEVHPGAKPFTLGSLIGDAILKAMDDAGLGGKDRAALSGLAAYLGFVLMQPDLAGQMAEDSAIADGMSKEDAAHLRMGVAIAAVVTTIIAMIAITVASGGASAAQLATSAQKVSQVASTAQKLSKAAQYAQVATGIVQGSSAIGGGATSIAIAQDKKAADTARAQAKEMEALLLKMQKMAEEQTEQLKEVIAALEESWQMFTSMIAAAGDQRARIARNVVQA